MAPVTLKVGQRVFRIAPLAQVGDVSHLPFSLRILLENFLRHEDGLTVRHQDIEALIRWDPKAPPEQEIAFRPSRVLLQDFTGVPAIVDLAAMREAIQRFGGDPKQINPIQPVDLVIDHSVQVDVYGTPDAYLRNTQLEVERNQERYQFLKWGQQAFRNFRVVPPGIGIVHQVNLEYLATVVATKQVNGVEWAFPDTLVGTDSHTTMVNGLGVLGWGVGGIEAEAAMLGQPVFMLIPQVVGVKLVGGLKPGTTATDLVLTVTQRLRAKGVVDKFVEFYGPGISALSLPDRATVANMAPEYGATIGFFPVDQETLSYLRLTGRPEELIQLVEAYTKAQGLFRTGEMPDPRYSQTIELDLGSIGPSLAGPKRPQDRVSLSEAKQLFRQALVAMTEGQPRLDPERVNTWQGEGGGTTPITGATAGSPPLIKISKVHIKVNGQGCEIGHGSVVIAAITSCTNTSNPAVMIGAGLLAKHAVKRGLTVKPWVKTSLAPGSKVVIDYLKAAGLLDALEALRFHLVGFGCTTCIGNSGPLPGPIEEAIREKDLVVVAVLSGNRNFEGRIHPLVRANYLASPPLVVAYAIAGTIDIDLSHEPLGQDREGRPVYLSEIWPSLNQINEAMQSIRAQQFHNEYRQVFDGDQAWRSITVPQGACFAWDEASTYVKRPPYLDEMTLQVPPLTDIRGARCLALLGNSVTTDHISPAGTIPADAPAGRYLIEHEVSPKEFNSFGARRGNHEVMVRGTFGNIRLRNLLAPGREGGWTRHLPDGQLMTIYEAAMRYRQEGVPLIVMAGKEYGSGSSRDWAAKGPALLGIKAVIAESFERIHRSNLIGMGILPLEFLPGENGQTLGLTGEEAYTIEGIAGSLSPGARLTMRAQGRGAERLIQVIARIDTPVEAAYLRHGGILPFVLRQLLCP